MEEVKKMCPRCASEDVFRSKHKTKWQWFGVCRDCWYKGLLNEFYQLPMEKLFKREGVEIFNNIIKL